MDGLFKKYICNPPTKGMLERRGFNTTLSMPSSWKSFIPPLTPAPRLKLRSQSPA